MSSMVCVPPARLLARATTTSAPRSLGVNDWLKLRNENRPWSAPRVALRHERPPSADTSTLEIPRPPSQAMPFTSNARPTGTSCPGATLVMIELTTISVIGSLASVICDPKCSISGNLLLGIRYAVLTQKLSKGLLIALIDVTCFIQYVPVQPATTMRAGKPFQCGSGSPFIS